MAGQNLEQKVVSKCQKVNQKIGVTATKNIFKGLKCHLRAMDSGDPNRGLVKYSNGSDVSDHQMVHLSDYNDIKTVLFSLKLCPKNSCVYY